MRKKIDSLGRIVIPIEVRRELQIEDGEQLDMEVESGKIIISKISNICALCGKDSAVWSIDGKGLCQDCYKKIISIEREF